METIPCKWCDQDTGMLYTEMCNGCWELDKRISMDLALSKRIIAHYDSVSQPNDPANAKERCLFCDRAFEHAYNFCPYCGRNMRR